MAFYYKPLKNWIIVRDYTKGLFYCGLWPNTPIDSLCETDVGLHGLNIWASLVYIRKWIVGWDKWIEQTDFYINISVIVITILNFFFLFNYAIIKAYTCLLVVDILNKHSWRFLLCMTESLGGGNIWSLMSIRNDTAVFCGCSECSSW